MNDFDAELLSATEEGAEQVEENPAWWDFTNLVWLYGTSVASVPVNKNPELQRRDPEQGATSPLPKSQLCLRLQTVGCFFMVVGRFPNKLEYGFVQK